VLPQNNHGPIIWVEGLIGAGKSTLTRQLAQELHLRGIYEPVETNPYLDVFYRDPKRWAFAMQIELLMRRYAMQQQAAWESVTMGGYNGAILDRGLPGDRVFCKLHRLAGNVSDLEWQTYERAYNIMTCALVPPSLLVFLDVQPDVAMARVRARNRIVETDLPMKYMEDLYRGYLDLLSEIQSGRHTWSRGMEIIRVPWNTDHLPVQYLIDTLRDKFNLDKSPPSAI
jgi:deoxyadenosine/deoxycytidine kinase